MKTVVVGFLGSSLDRRGRHGRWEVWRPSVAVCQHETLLVDRFHLLIQRRDRSLAEGVRDDIAMVSPETEVVLEELDLERPWDFELVFERLLDYSRHLRLDREREQLLVHITTGTHVAQICLFLLTEAGFFPGRLLQTGPGRQNTPPGSYDIIDLDLSRYDAIARRFAVQTRDDLSLLKSGIATRNPAFNRTIAEIEQVAGRSTAPILLTGPTGAGKSRLARQIFELRRQRAGLNGPLVEVNCATLRGDLAMSTLFGHRKGAFTGAATDRPGLLQKADRGLLFLDEIGELGLDEQAMLLRAIEDRRFFPVGADVEVASDFQLIAGTNRDLAAAVRAGRFRDDLLARVSFWRFHLPGLAERREDLEPNLAYELNRQSRLAGRPVTMSTEARRHYLQFAVSDEALWSGNFRDLTNSVARMATLAPGCRIGTAEVAAELARLRAAWGTTGAVQPAPPAGLPTDARPPASSAPDVVTELLGPTATEALDRFDRVQLAEVIAVCRASRTLADAGRKLFAVSRQHRRQTNDTDRLRKYLQRFGLTWRQVAD